MPLPASMPMFDLTSQIHKDFFTTFPHLKADAAAAVFWSPVQTLRIDGREATDTSSSTYTGLFLTGAGQIVVYGGQWRLMQRQWLDFDKSELDKAQFHYDFDPRNPYVFVECRLKEGQTRAQFRVSILPTQIDGTSLLPGFPQQIAVGDSRYALPASHVTVAVGADAFRVRQAVVARRPNATIVRSWRDDLPEDLILNDADFLGTICNESVTSFLWWRRHWLTAVQFSQPPVLDSVAERVVDEQPAAGRPFIAQTRGMIGGTLIRLQSCLWIPMDPSGSFLVIDESRRTHGLSSPARVHSVNGCLALICSEANTCVALRQEGVSSEDLARTMGLSLSPYPESPEEYLMFLEPVEGGDNFDGNDIPALLALEGCRFRSRISPWPVDVESVRIDRNRDSRYWIHTSEGSVLKASVAEADDLRLRKSIMHTRIVDRMQHNDRMSSLYEILNDLRVRRFMHGLFAELLLLHQELEQPPLPKEILERLEDYPSFDRATAKQVCQDLLPKMLLLAQSLPPLKRHLERLGTFYPYQVRNWDDAWLKEAFGEPVAGQWSAANGSAHVDRLRGFVRGTQASLWRSLAEIERGLGPLEPVYSEKLKAARGRAMKRQYGIGGALGLAGLATGLAGGPWYLAANASVTLVTALISSLESNQQHQTLLLEHGREVLEWWNIFVESFCVQVYESRRFLEAYFDVQSKRDCDMYKKLMSENKTDHLNQLKDALHKQIRAESAHRFEHLWEGATQVRQDLIESLDRIALTDVKAVLERIDARQPARK